MKGQPSISAQDAGVTFFKRRGLFQKEPFDVLRNITMDVFPGQSIGVVGRNGSGKSTLLRLLAGILACDTGRVVSSVMNISLLSLQVGFDAMLSGRQNAVMSGMLLGCGKREIEDRMDRIIAFSELGNAIDQPLRTYSNGMRARLGFSVALHAAPDVLMIDEVLGVGDIRFRKKAVAALTEKIKSELTVVMVSHVPGTIKELCDRVVWIEKGEIVMAGNPDEVIGAYESEAGKPALA